MRFNCGSYLKIDKLYIYRGTGVRNSVVNMCWNMKPILLTTRKDDDQEVTSKSPWRSGMVWSAWRLTRRQLSLHQVPPQHFARSQWQTASTPSRVYLAYRWMLLLFLLSTAISSFACQEIIYPEDYEGLRVELNYFKWFIYLTNWGFMLCVVQAALAVVIVHKSWTQRSLSITCESGGSECSEEASECEESRQVKTPLLCRAYWMAQVIATDLAFVITLIYWGLVHDPKIHRVNALNVLVHGCNSLVMMTEVLVTSHPVRPLHALYTIAFGTVYSAFSLIYFLAGGTDRHGGPAIYKALDWRYPGTALTFVAICACVMCGAHALHALAAYVRRRIAARCLPARAHPPNLDKLSALVVIE